VFLGRVEHIKGPHLAIEIAKRSGRALVIAGNVPPEHRPWFEREVAPHVDGKRIRYIGPVDDVQKSELLGAASALLMPILWEEPFGIVMAEALACGTPVLGMARGAIPEVVEDGVTGFVERDLDGLVAAVARLPRISREACRDRARRLFSDTAVVEEYLAVYRDILAARGRRLE
jgi:glycosyltransferase involved in cell wall biosynthesis